MAERRVRGDCVGISSEDLDLAKELPVEPLSLLLRASQYAQNSCCDDWRFGLELTHLRNAGLSECDLRWLASKGYVEHTPPFSAASIAHRSCDESRAPRFADRTEFILTPIGRTLARSVLAAIERLDDPRSIGGPARPQILVPSATVPFWDHERRELRLGRTVVKRFCVPAENQETILTAFEEEAWTVHIDDPLPPAGGIDPKRRLHSAIQCLNRNQQARMLNFHGDGTGRGVRWELLPFPAQA